MSNSIHHRESATPSDPQLERALRTVLSLGVLLVVLVPAARGYSDWLGWMPLWLVAMPAMAWWSLHRFRLPMRKRVAGSASLPARRRRPGTQARRRMAPALRKFDRAA